jgi:hypothetical protein
MPEFDRLLLFRALRPDRLTAAMKKFVTNMIGSKYVTSQPYDLQRSFQDSVPGTPIFVFLSPGVDVVSSLGWLCIACGVAALGLQLLWCSAGLHDAGSARSACCSSHLISFCSSGAPLLLFYSMIAPCCLMQTTAD